jgi:hypothetical protein
VSTGYLIYGFSRSGYRFFEHQNWRQNHPRCRRSAGAIDGRGFSRFEKVCGDQAFWRGRRT